MTVVVFCAVFYYFCEFLFWMVLSRVQLLVLFWLTCLVEWLECVGVL